MVKCRMTKQMNILFLRCIHGVSGLERERFFAGTITRVSSGRDGHWGCPGGLVVIQRTEESMPKEGLAAMGGKALEAAPRR